MTAVRGKYETLRGVKHIAAASLLETYHGKDKLIDLLNIDIEGAEYSIFEAMLRDPVFQNVCQFNVEMHIPNKYPTLYNIPQTIKLFERFVQDGTFIWVKADILRQVYFPSFFVNVKNPNCYQKFLLNRLE